MAEPWENEDRSTNVDGWLAAYAADSNTFWRTDSGHIMNVVDELLDRIETLESELSFANDCLTKASGYLAGEQGAGVKETPHG